MSIEYHFLKEVSDFVLGSAIGLGSGALLLLTYFELKKMRDKIKN